MSIHVALRHHTKYQYDRPVVLTPHLIRLRPAAHCRTPIQAYTLKIQPENHFVSWQQDPFGNHIARVVFPKPVTELVIDVEVIADLTVINPFDFFIEDFAEEWPFDYSAQVKKELQPYLEVVEEGPLLDEWMVGIDRTKRRTIDFLVDLNSKLQAHIGYGVRLEPGIQPCEVTLKKKTGSCRDSAWLLVQILRRLGLGARFVSGYLVQLSPDEKSLEGPSGPEKDFTDLHAWAEVFVPGAGWIGLDPTSGLFVGEGHIPLACTPDPASAAPVVGASGPCECEMEFGNDVFRIREDPRVTKPYTEAQWMAIDALGEKVDAELEAGDVRLTMGGEPTFVSIDDMEGDQWNTVADGPEKRKLADELLHRMRKAYAPGGMLHYGEGKWYPGEALPRWAYTCFWRKDGIPVWKNDKWIADIHTDYQVTAKHAEAFIRKLTAKLGVSQHHVCEAYEDVFYQAWSEGSLPVDEDPMKCDLKDPLERQFLTEWLKGDPAEPTGFVLPLRWDGVRRSWVTAEWKFRRDYMFLVPGTSCMGLRLPLGSIPALSPEERPADFDPDLFVDLPPLEDAKPPESASLTGVSVTAICVEPRKGRLHVFMPPIKELEGWLALLAVVESCAAICQKPIVLEGYEPPHDPRLERFKVTPDPGVIEFNIHPSISWRELVERNTVLYDEARLCRLGTEKFMVDGRHTGTGGGNHVVMGAASPGDSPFLRRPSVLRSLITYWQHHPGLSYLFSGLFVGPTSQAPRVDEGRDDRLYELEIAFQQFPEGDTDAPWLVDRLLRNLLTDLTGNTHRAEFCIDKLYSPSGSTGRLGLLELRAFEMPPHARMSLVQMLLLRVLVARFWTTPYHHELIPWGTALHDRFMLPHFVRADLEDVVQDIQQAGYAFDIAWLNPFFEFRFPRYGTMQLGNIDLELRMAIEPWHVLGEESSSQGTARYVDSSVERIQVKVSGLTDGRHVLACNGRRISMQPTGVPTEFVAGIRYQAWAPWSALHPTIAPQSPLTFDIIDTWNGRSIGGCVYHVSHLGGLNYDRYPVNAYEAESRRVGRFWNQGHTPAPMDPALEPVLEPDGQVTERHFEQVDSHAAQPVPPVEFNPEYPYTFDLRRTF